MTSTGRNTIQDVNESIDVSKLRCLGDYVLVEVAERLKTKGGIILLKGKATECVIGKVVKVGKELPNSYRNVGYPLGVSVGDYVLTMGYIGEVMSIRDGEYRFIHAHGLWAKLKIEDLETYQIEGVEPLFAYLVVEPFDDEVTKGGIHLAQGHDADQELRKAHVVSVGPGQWSAKTGERLPLSVKPGVDIFMRRYAGANMEVKGKTLRIIDYSDIASVLEG